MSNNDYFNYLSKNEDSINNNNNQNPNNPFHSENNYSNLSSYSNSEVITTPINDIETPTILKEKKPKKKKGGFAKAMAFILVAVISGSAGGGLTYTYLLEQNKNSTSIVQEAEKNTNITNTNNSGAEMNSVSDVVDKAANSVVEIKTSSEVTANPFIGSSRVQEGAGSGVVISSDGYIVTNYHVISNADEVFVRTSDGTEYPATLIGYDKQTDIAVLKIDAQDLVAVEFADSDIIKVGEVAVAIGNPLGTLGGTVTEGIVSAKDRKIEMYDETTGVNEIMTLLQTSAAVSPGNSGGGLFNSSGNLIGIVNAKSSGSGVEGIGYAIPSNMVKEVVDDIIKNGYVSGRPQLGIETIEVKGAEALFAYRLEEEGVYIVKNNKDSGLLVGDKIEAVDGEEITTSSDIKAAIKNKKVGETVSITVKRDGETKEVVVTLTETAPEN